MNEEQRLNECRGTIKGFRVKIEKTLSILEDLGKYGKSSRNTEHLSHQYLSERLTDLQQQYLEQRAIKAEIELEILRKRYRIDLPVVQPDLPRTTVKVEIDDVGLRRLEAQIIMSLDLIKEALDHRMGSKVQTIGSMLTTLQTKYLQKAAVGGKEAEEDAALFVISERQKRGLVTTSPLIDAPGGINDI